MFKLISGKLLLPRISGKLASNRIIFRQKRTCDINRVADDRPSFMTFTIMWDEAMTNYSLKNTTPLSNRSLVDSYRSNRMYK